MPLARVSDKFLAFLDDYRKNHKGISREEATEEILKTLQQPQPITSDVPFGMPLDPEKQAALKKLKEEQTYEVQELPIPPCNFCAKGYIDHKLGQQFIYCDNKNKYPKEKHPLSIPLGTCQKCWERREWVKQKREREQDEKPIDAEPEEIEPPKCSHLKDGTIYIRQEIDKLKDFPVGTKLIYCMDGGFWKTLEQCLQCFKGGKTSTPIGIDIGEIESQDMGEPDF